MARYHGRAGRLYASVNAAAAAVPVASLSNWTLAMKTARVDVTAYGDPNLVYVQGLRDLQGTFTGWWDDTDQTVQTASQSPTGTNLYLYPSTTAAARYAYGPAWMDVSMDVGVSSAVKISGTFAANGGWGVLF